MPDLFAQTEADPAAWWDGLADWHKNQLRHDAELPLKFKIGQPWEKIAAKDQAALLALRPAFDAKQAEQARQIEARERKTARLIARLEAGYQRENGEGDADYFARCIEYHYTLPRGDEVESWSILRRLMPPLCSEGEAIAVPLPKSSKIEGLRINILRTPCGWTTGQDWSLGGWMGTYCGADFWPEIIEGEEFRGYHPTRDAALSKVVGRLCTSFENISKQVHDSVGTDSARKSCADAVPILRDWLAANTQQVERAPESAPVRPAKAVQLDLFA